MTCEECWVDVSYELVPLYNEYKNIVQKVCKNCLNSYYSDDDNSYVFRSECPVCKTFHSVTVKVDYTVKLVKE